MSDTIKKKICFIYDKELEVFMDRIYQFKDRHTAVRCLIESYNLLSNDIYIIKPNKASEEKLKNFHTDAYINFTKQMNEMYNFELIKEGCYDDELVKFGLAYDCPLIENCYELISKVAGGTIDAVRMLCYKNICDTAINWYGGWHHADKNKAEGFCYVNDIVLGIRELQRKFSKILYVDLDVHHGDGVESAFIDTKDVLTLSFHRKSPGFYPGGGSLDDIGSPSALYHAINVPFLEGICDKNYLKLFNNIFPRVFQSYSPSAIVVQCGGDILYGDPLGGCNISMKAMGCCLKMILDCNISTLILGGGGYNTANTARYRTYLTSIVLKKDLSDDIPDSCAMFTIFEPTYELQIETGSMKDYNTDNYIENVIKTIHSYCSSIEH